jgi:hypothetical protein
MVISRTTRGGLFGYYNYTSKHLGDLQGRDGVVTTGFIIECFGGGLTSCPRGLPIKEMSLGTCDHTICLDEIDKNQGADLVDYALDQITNNNLVGNYTIQVNVNNQVMRVYTVSWNSSNVNGDNSDIQVERVL